MSDTRPDPIEQQSGESDTNHRLRLVQGIQRAVEYANNSPSVDCQTKHEINTFVERIDLASLYESDNTNEALAWFHQRIHEVSDAGRAAVAAEQYKPIESSDEAFDLVMGQLKKGKGSSPRPPWAIKPSAGSAARVHEIACAGRETVKTSQTKSSADVPAKIEPERNPEVVGHTVFNKPERAPIYIPLVAAAVLFIALVPDLPYGYFKLLRLVVFSVSIITWFAALPDRRGWLWTMGGMGILFNPIFPMRFDRDTWEILDLVAGIIFLFSIPLFRAQRRKR